MAGTIGKERLKGVLENDLLTVTLDVKGKEVEIEPRLFLNIEENELKARGYTITVNGTEKKVENFDGLIKTLSDLGAVGKEYDLSAIDGYYKTVEELDAKHDFDNISMRGLLKRYARADEFELVVPYYDGGMTDEQAENAYGDVAENMRRASRYQYEKLPEEERAKLPDFDTLYGLIEEECRAFCEKNAAKIDERNGNNFFSDEFSRGNTQFTEPTELWHIYEAVDFVQVCAWQNERLKGKESHPLGGEIENNPVLKDALIFIKITYSWHCTTSGAPAKLFRFKLNDKTKAWLLTHETDYEIERDGFEDLSLYCGEELLFSSCTHEHFHTDCEKA